MSCAGLFCVAPDPATHVSSDVRQLPATPAAQDARAVTEIERTRSVDPDGVKEGAVVGPNPSPKSVASLLDQEEQDASPAEADHAPDATDDAVSCPPVKESKGHVARAIFADSSSDVLSDEYASLRQLTRENKQVARLMEENIRKEFQISSLEAALQAHSRNPTVANACLEQEIQQLKSKFADRETRLCDRIVDLEASVKCLQVDIDMKQKFAEVAKEEHQKEVVALQLINQRQAEDFQNRLLQVEAEKAAVLDTLQQRMEEADRQRAGLMETLTDRISELNEAESRVQELENELKLRDLMEQSRSMNAADDTHSGIVPDKPEQSPEDEHAAKYLATKLAEEKKEDDDAEQRLAAATLSFSKTRSFHEEQTVRTAVSVQDNHNDNNNMGSIHHRHSEDDADDSDEETSARLSAALARLTKQAEKAGMDMSSTEAEQSRFDKLIGECHVEENTPTATSVQEELSSE